MIWGYGCPENVASNFFSDLAAMFSSAPRLQQRTKPGRLNGGGEELVKG
jgi:hypothetical protein